MKLNTYKYQSGVREGTFIHPRAVAVVESIMGFSRTDAQWGNDHDIVLEQLSDAVFEIEQLKTGGIRRLYLREEKSRK